MMNIKCLFSLILFSTVSFCFSQQEISLITPQDLYNSALESSKNSVIQFWVPNCENVDEIVNHYESLEHRYGDKIDFYFLGITEKEELVRDLMNSHSYNFKMYIIDPSVDENLVQRRATFAKEFSKLIEEDDEDFLTLFMDPNEELIYRGNLIVIEKKDLDEFIKPKTD